MRELSSEEAHEIAGAGVDCEAIGQSYANLYADAATAVGAGAGAYVGGSPGAVIGSVTGAAIGDATHDLNSAGATALCNTVTGSTSSGSTGSAYSPAPQEMLIIDSHWDRLGSL